MAAALAQEGHASYTSDSPPRSKQVLLDQQMAATLTQEGCESVSELQVGGSHSLGTRCRLKACDECMQSTACLHSMLDCIGLGGVMDATK